MKKRKSQAIWSCSCKNSWRDITVLKTGSLRLKAVFKHSWLKLRLFSKTSSKISLKSSKKLRFWWVQGFKRAKKNSSHKRQWLRSSRQKLRKALKLRCKWPTILKKTLPCVTSRSNSWQCNWKRVRSLSKNRSASTRRWSKLWTETMKTQMTTVNHRPVSSSFKRSLKLPRQLSSLKSVTWLWRMSSCLKS